jgi:uncharacterized protein
MSRADASTPTPAFTSVGEPPAKERSRICRKAEHYMPARHRQQQRPEDSHMSPAPPGLVIDTNVVLDWLVFADPASDQLSVAIHERQVRWLVCPSVMAELEQVLARPLADRWETVRKRALTLEWMASVVHCADPPPATGAALVCSDPDDQKFIDLAIHQGARWLLTRDRALLALRVAARRLGVGILTPMDWGGAAEVG